MICSRDGIALDFICQWTKVVAKGPDERTWVKVSVLSSLERLDTIHLGESAENNRGTHLDYLTYWPSGWLHLSRPSTTDHLVTLRGCFLSKPPY